MGISTGFEKCLSTEAQFILLYCDFILCFMDLAKFFLQSVSKEKLPSPHAVLPQIIVYFICIWLVS